MPKAMGKMAIRGVKNVGKGVWKNKRKIARGIGRGVGAVAGATVGLAAGVASGDPSNALTYLGAGAVAGNMIGKNATNMVADTAVAAKNLITDKGSSLKNAWNEERYGAAYAIEQQRKANNKKAREEFLKDDSEKEKYKNLAVELGYQGNVKELMQNVADYKEAGVDDDDMIKNALELEQSRGGIGGDMHNNIVDIAKFATSNNVDKSIFDDDRKYAGFKRVVETTEVMPGQSMNPKEQEQVMGLTAQLVGRENVYKQRMKEELQQKRKGNTKKTKDKK